MKRKFTKYPQGYVKASYEGCDYSPEFRINEEEWASDCHYVSKIRVDGDWEDIQEYTDTTWNSQQSAISDAQDAMRNGYKARVDIRKYYSDGNIVDEPGAVEVPYVPYFDD